MSDTGGGAVTLERTRRILFVATIVIVLVLGVVVFLSIASLGPGVRASIAPDIYAPAAGYGYLNESASFSVNFSNYHLVTHPGVITIIGAGVVLANRTVPIPPNSSRIVAVFETLNVTGTWTVKATYDGRPIASYSFQVVPSLADAHADVSRWNQAQSRNELVWASAFVAVAAAGIFAVLYPRVRRRRAPVPNP